MSLICVQKGKDVCYLQYLASLHRGTDVVRNHFFFSVLKNKLKAMHFCNESCVCTATAWHARSFLNASSRTPETGSLPKCACVLSERRNGIYRIVRVFSCRGDGEQKLESAGQQNLHLIIHLLVFYSYFE